MEPPPRKSKSEEQGQGASSPPVEVELKEKLAFFAAEHGPRICFNVAAVNTPLDVSAVVDVLEKCGVVFLTNAVSLESCSQAKENLRDAMEKMFKYNLDNTSMPESLEAWSKFRNSKNGFGNASFGFVNKQFTARNVTPTTLICGEQVFMAHNCVWTRVNLPLLETNLHTTALLLAVTHFNGQVSIESAKYASNPSPKPSGMTPQKLTQPHVDIYAGGIERFQALIVDEAAVKLGFVVGSHTLAKEIGAAAKINLETASGYVGLDGDELKDAFSAGWLAPPPRSLVIWKSGVVHFEATSKPGKDQPFVFDSWADQKDSPRFRVAVGTHMPMKMEREDLIKVAVLAERGLIPDFYQGINKATKLYPNIVNSKNTQYKIARIANSEEQTMMRQALEVSPTDESAQEWQTMSPLRKHLVGVTQDVALLPDGFGSLQFTPVAASAPMQMWLWQSTPNGRVSADGRSVAKLRGTSNGWNCEVLGNTSWDAGIQRWTLLLPEGGSGVAIGVCRDAVPSLILHSSNAAHCISVHCASGEATSPDGKCKALPAQCSAKGVQIMICLDLDQRTLLFGMNGHWNAAPSFVNLSAGPWTAYVGFYYRNRTVTIA